ncbi:MAG: hypothetical protein K0B37_06370 [Bacteroidales bacterium]|nr:hypothetical protein [Bacteroidales bacterium]
MVPYIRPQENGNKTDVRWAALTNGQGTGLLAISDPGNEREGFEMTAMPYLTADFDAREKYDYGPVHLELAVINDVKPRDFKYSFMLVPVQNMDVEEMVKMGKKF